MSKMFRDAQGREWHPRITVATLADYEDLTGISLMTARRIYAGKLGNIARLGFLACKAEAAERECNFTEFADGITSQEKVAELTAALEIACADFFPSPSREKPAAANPGPGAPSTNSPPRPA